MAKNQTTKTSATSVNETTTIFNKFENWAETNNSKLLFTFLILSLFFSFLLFNARISEAHDDALYLEGGWRYVNEFPNYFYTQNAPLYVLFLGLMINFFGFKLLLFKLLNVFFQMFAVYFFYKSFYKRLPAVVFIPVMIFVSCNHLIQYYASMTFTESFFLFLQSLFFYWFTKLYDALKLEPNSMKHLKLWAMVGMFSFLITTCKSVAIVVIPAFILYFIIEKQYKNIGFAIGSYLLFKIPYEIIVKLIWDSQSQFAGQSKILLQKDPYDKSLGNEDLSGFIERFFTNSNLYLSKRFFQLLGLRDEQSVEVYGLLTLILFVIILLGIYKVFKQKNNIMVFFGLYTGSQLLLSFLILQARWDQPRIVLVAMPIILLLIFNLFYEYVKNKSFGQNIFVVIMLVLSCSILLSSFKRGSNNFKVFKKNLAGDMYYGYTPDWQNFLKCSQWCADSLPPNTFVASRKAPMSFVYGKGKKFFPIYSVIKKDSVTNQSNPDSALAFFNEKGITHILIGSLRSNPTQNNGQIINTVHNIVQPIMQKYPNKLKIIHTEGYSEQAYILEIVK